MFAERKLLEG